MKNVSGAEIRNHAERRIDPSAVLALYATEGWWPERTSTQVATVLNSGPAVGAWAGLRKRPGKLWPLVMIAWRPSASV